MRYECEKCPSKFTTPKCLKRHKKHVHELDKKSRDKFHCDICDNTYLTKSALQTHKSSHQTESLNKVKCDVCYKKLSNLNDLKKHLRRIHKKI